MRRTIEKQIISTSALSANFAAAMRKVRVRPIGILRKRKIEAYLISADAYEALLARLDDSDLLALAHARRLETPEPVKLEEL